MNLARARRAHSWIVAGLAALCVAVNDPIGFAGSVRLAHADEADAGAEPAPPEPVPLTPELPPPAAPEPPTSGDTQVQPGGPMERSAAESVDEPASAGATISPDGRSEAARPPAPAAPRPAPRRPAPARVVHAANEVAIRLAVEPSGVAHAFWGVKDLGEAPLEIIRPRDSGPMDILVRAPGYLTFHTRAYTDRDDKIAIRMVPNFQAAGTFGYRPADRAGSPVAKTRDPKPGFHRENPALHGTKR